MTIINIADCLSTTVDPTTFSILAQVGNASSPEVYSDNNEIWSPPGLISIPAGITKIPTSVAPQLVYLERPDQNIVIGHKDTRLQDIIGTLQPGETCLFGGGATGTAQGRILIKADGGINLYTTVGNAAGNNGLGMFLSAAQDTIQITTSGGNAYVANPSSVTLMTNGAASGITLNTDGTANLIATKGLQIDGASISIGSGTAGLPLAPTNAAVINPNYIITLFTQVITTLTLINTAISTAVSSAPGSPVVAPGVVASIAQVVALTSALGLATPGTPATGIGSLKCVIQ